MKRSTLYCHALSAIVVYFSCGDAVGQTLLPIVVDNLASSNTLVGNWTSSTSVSGFIGSNYVHDGNSGKGNKSFTFTVPIAVAGTYQLRLYATVAPNRASSIPVTVTDLTGKHDISINEQSPISNLALIPLGSFQFAAKSNATVVISNAGTKGYVIVDGLELDFTSSQSKLPVPSVTDGTLGSYSLAWSDEFNESSLDLSQWVYRTDAKGLSAQMPKNILVSGGLLHIANMKQTVGSMHYTGGGVITTEQFNYGFYEARFKVPPGAGWHTSFWAMKSDGSGGTGTSTADQEIDICESGSQNHLGYSSGVLGWANGGVSLGRTLTTTPNLGTGFHIWGAEFTPTEVRYYFDGVFKYSVDISKIRLGAMNIWLTSIAGIDTNTVDDATLPSSADFDYVRYFAQ